MHTTPPNKSLFTLVVLLLVFAVGHSQVHCGLVQIEPNSSVNAMMTSIPFQSTLVVIPSMELLRLEYELKIKQLSIRYVLGT